MFAEVDIRMIEQMGAVGVICMVLVFGGKWMIGYVGKMSDRYAEAMKDQVTQNRRVMEELGAVIGENTTVLRDVKDAIRDCPVKREDRS